jgi:hypothetical protein
MSKKPDFETARGNRLLRAKHELNAENKNDKPVKTTLVIESSLLFAVKEIALKRKQAGKKPDTVTSIIREALKEVISKEK